MAKVNKTSETKLEVNQRYLTQLEDIKIRVPKGYRDVIKNYAKEQGLSVNQLVIRALQEYAKSNGTTLEVPSGIKELKATEE